MKMPGAQTGTYQQSLNAVVLSNRADLRIIKPGDELPNQRIKALRKLLWERGIFVTASRAIELLSLHGLMAWTQYTIKQQAKLRRSRDD